MSKSFQLVDHRNQGVVNTLVEMGELYFKGKEFESAQKHCQQALTIDNECTEAYLLLGQIALQFEQIETARKLVLQAITLQPQNASFRVCLGDIAQLFEDYEMAQAQYALALKLNPSEPKVFIKLAVLFKKIGKVNEAITLFRQIIASNKDDVEPLIELADLYMSISDFGQAEQLAKKARGLAPINLKALSILATVYFTQEKVQHIIDLGLEIADIDPLNAVNYSRMASAYAGKGHVDNAIKYAWLALQIDPDVSGRNILLKLVQEGGTDDIQNLAVLTEVSIKGDQLSKAYDYAQKILTIDARSETAYSLLGQIAFKNKQYSLAEECFYTALSFSPKYLKARRSLGIVQYTTGKFKDAEININQALQLDSTDYDALFYSGMLLRQKQNYDGAVSQFQLAISNRINECQAKIQLALLFLLLKRFREAKAVALDAYRFAPDDPENLITIWTCCNSLGRPEEAYIWAKKIVELRPLDSSSHIKLAIACSNVGKKNLSGVKHARHALHLEPNNAEALIELALTLFKDGDWDQALEYMDRALLQSPNNLKYQIHKVRLLHRLGRLEEAFNLVKPHVLNKESISLGALKVFIPLAKQFGQTKLADKLIQEALVSNMLPPPEKMNLSFLAAHFYDKNHNYDQAFNALKIANDLKYTLYETEKLEAGVSRVIESFSPGFFSKKDVAAIRKGVSPIFIIGMPRSGTSLTEKIISRHSLIYGAGELTGIGELVNGMTNRLRSDLPYPECIQQLTLNDLNNMSYEYLKFIDQLNTEKAAYVVDKQPQNYFMIGLIHLLFPESTIIHCRRDPIDTCLSCYFQYFAFAEQDFSYSLDHLVHYYHQYERIMQHWEQVLPGRVYNLYYEELTSNPTEQIPLLIEQCGLDWDEACLTPHESDSVTKTASFEQVRKPIYQTSQQRWRHYEKHLQPLIDGLRDCRYYQEKGGFQK